MGNVIDADSGYVLGSEKMYRDEAGQWWMDRFNKRRASAGHKGETRVRCYVGTCHRCGRGFVSNPSTRHADEPHCSHPCYIACKKGGGHGGLPTNGKGADSHRWNGGRIKRKGYILVYMPEHHSIAGRGTQRKYVLEHRIVMEEILGRPLLPNETVHHKNGITHDNSPENLELWGYQPSGQRVGEGKHCETCTCASHV